MKKIILTFYLILFVNTLIAQKSIIIGIIRDKKTSEEIAGAVVSIKNTTEAAATQYDGTFVLQTKVPLPVTLHISYIGYTSIDIVVSSTKERLEIDLQENSLNLNEVIIYDSRITERQKQSPISIETMDAIAIKETPALSFYDGLANLKGVDLISSGIGFKIINTRGFNSTFPTRSLQLIDGVDNQSPGLNFSLGNFLGSSELDVNKVDLVVGASSSYFGPGAFNGVVNMQTKDPFKYQGISVMVKAAERNYLETSLRWAKAFKNSKGIEKFAFKLNFSFMKVYEWEATNYDPTSQSPVKQNNPGGYDAVNVYGDEFTGNALYSPLSNLTYVGYGYTLRDGYKEKYLVNYNTHNLKTNLTMHYKLNKKNELIAASSFSTGTTILQGDNRFLLKDIIFFQNRIELRKEGKYFLRAYATNEDAGNSYDIYATALIMQNAAKSDNKWGDDYKARLVGTIGSKVNNWYFQNINGKGIMVDTIPADERLNYIENYWQTVFKDTLIKYHNLARLRANSNENRYQPGTERFDSALSAITSRTNREGGSGFFDKSALYHLAGEYKFNLLHLNFTTGGNYRIYAPFSKGTIYLDTAKDSRIYNREYGLYIGVEKKILSNKLRLSATGRMDKNKNFKMLISPALTAVYVQKQHIFRLSFSSALRNPTLQDQYFNLNVGRATILGNLNGFDSLVSVRSLIDAFNNNDKSYLNYFNVEALKPEQVRTIELGYRGNLSKKVYVDISYYFNRYINFIGYKIGAKVINWYPPGFPEDVKIYRVATNSKAIVNSQGFAFGINYFIKNYIGIVANYSLNMLVQKSNDPLIPAYNTPKGRYNIGINGRNIHTTIGSLKIKNWSYNINWKWQDGFEYTGSPQFTGYVPSYGFLDFQISKKLQRAYCTLKAGATNVLNKKVMTVYGGSYIGRMGYISVLFDLNKQK